MLIERIGPHLYKMYQPGEYDDEGEYDVHVVDTSDPNQVKVIEGHAVIERWDAHLWLFMLGETWDFCLTTLTAKEVWRRSVKSTFDPALWAQESMRILEKSLHKACLGRAIEIDHALQVHDEVIVDNVRFFKNP